MNVVFELLCVCDVCALIFDVRSLHVNVINIGALIVCTLSCVFVCNDSKLCFVCSYSCVVDEWN